MKQVELNRAEVWIADHALPIFAAVALAIVAGAVAIFAVFLETGETRDQVNVLRPQVTRVNKAICDKQSLDHPHRAERCAERIRVGLVNCRRSEPCRAALIAAITYPPPARSAEPLPNPSKSVQGSGQPGGDAFQPPSTGHQQPGPHEGGGENGHGNGGSGGKGGSEGPPAPGQGGSEAAPAPQEGGADAGQSREPPTPKPTETAPAVPHPAAEAVEHVEDTVHETVEGVKETACGLTKSC